MGDILLRGKKQPPYWQL